MIIHVHPDSSVTYNADEAVDRPYEFDQGDQRVTLVEWDPGARRRRATERARETGLTQQVKLVDGPLHHQKQWLIQSIEDVKPVEKPRLRESLGGPDLFAHLVLPGDDVEDFEPESVAFTEVRDFVNMIFEDTSLELVDYSHYSDASVWLKYEVDEGDEALTSIAAHVADRFVDGRKVRLDG